MDERTVELFRNIKTQLNLTCAKGQCNECAFSCKGFCGTNILESIMSKLTGASIIDQQHHSDMELIKFIVLNPQQKEEE